MHVPARVMGQFTIFLPGLCVIFFEFCPGYGPALRRFSIIMNKC